MSKKYRLTLIALSLLILLAVGRIITGGFDFVLDDFWFASGLLLLILLSLIDQPHFSKDSNVFVNAIAAGISLLLVENSNRDSVFYIFFSVTGYLAISSYVLMWVRQRSLDSESRYVRLISRLNRELGKPLTLFSFFFVWGAVQQFGAGTSEFNALLAYWMIFLLLNIPSVATTIEDFFTENPNSEDRNAIGQIFGVQSKNTFLVKLLPPSKRSAVKLFDLVEFKYSMDDRTRKCLVLDTYLLNQEQWVKVLSNRQIDETFHDVTPVENAVLDVVYKLPPSTETDFLDRLVGIVTDDSRIGKIRFVYNSKTSVKDGQLLEVDVDGKAVLYQLVEGLTKIETLEHKNQSGLIVGEAIQLGTWDKTKLQFEQFGWVPSVNAPVFLAADIDAPNLQNDEFEIGKIPDTNYPVAMNKSDALSHHMAIVGVTGTGKSVFARNLLREFISDPDVKVICVDFTGEYVGKFSDLDPTEVIPTETSSELFKKIDTIERTIADNYNKDNDASLILKKEVATTVNQKLEEYLKGDDQLAIFELPDVENTSGVLTYTKTFFRNLFYLAKKHNNYGKRVCLVLEEAHTVVPEWNFSGVSDKISQPLINSIAQIALQGRKYNVGLVVIAQRTANVSKTILTQCNTMVSFQVFDKTSSDFMANYFGQDIVSSLPKLKTRQAIAAGKAFRGGVPLIFEVPEITEPGSVYSAAEENALTPPKTI